MQKRNEAPFCVQCVDKPKTETPKTENLRFETEESFQKPIKEQKQQTTTGITGHNDIEATLIEKLQWATNELKLCSNIKQTIELCELIKSASDALTSVKQCFNK